MAAGDLITLAELKARLETTENESDAVLGAVITGASAAIAQHTSRLYVPEAGATKVRAASAWSNGGAPLWVGDIRTLTSVTVKDADDSTVATIPGSSFVLEPRSRTTGPAYAIRPKSTVTQGLADGYALSIVADWGWDAVPAHAVEACVQTCRAWLRQDAARWAGVPDVGGDYMVAPTPAATWMLPLAAKQLLQNDRLRGVA